MYALDTNLLVYAHNTASPFHPQAKTFIEKVMNERDIEGNLSICIPGQVLTEFLNVITRHQLGLPLPLHEATQLVQAYIDTGVAILYPTSTQLTTLLDLLKSVTTRQKIFDVALVATLKDHGIAGLYTVNTSDFDQFAFLDVKNPL
jgi:predicted nucleic acid-binding protein